MRPFPKDDIADILKNLGAYWPDPDGASGNSGANLNEVVVESLGKLEELWQERRKGERRLSSQHHHAVLESDVMPDDVMYLFRVDSGTSLLPVYTTERRKQKDRRNF